MNAANHSRVECSSQDVDKLRVANAFEKAAKYYNKYSIIQQQVSLNAIGKLTNLLADNKHEKADWLLDIGCGPAPNAKQVSTFSRNSLGIDIAYSMLAEAKESTCVLSDNVNQSEQVEPQFAGHTNNVRSDRAKQSENKRNSSGHSFEFLNCDAESLAIKTNSVDIVYSSMALQWCSSPQTVLNEVYRVLKPQGRALLAIMVGESFCQLHNAFSTIGKRSRVNRFHLSEDWVSACDKFTWSFEYQIERHTSYHPSAYSMLKSLKQIGANTFISKQASNYENNHHLGSTSLQANAYLPKGELKQLDQYFKESFKHKSSFPLEYQILYLSIQK